MTALVPLTRGLVALVDDADFARVMNIAPWSASVKPGTSYALRAGRRPDGHPTTIRMHNFITGLPFIDHVNGDGLDNRRCNLRSADKSRNGANRGAPRQNTTGFKGVTWHKAAGKFAAQIEVLGRRQHLGLFVTAEEAAQAYDQAALEAWGAYAWLNFPRVEETA